MMRPSSGPLQVHNPALLLNTNLSQLAQYGATSGQLGARKTKNIVAHTNNKPLQTTIQV